jgi:RimJ/RimL family protein N-acetyltransferase
MNEITDLERLSLQCETLFTLDANGDLVSVREPGYEPHELDPAPRFWMGRAVQGNLWRYRVDVPEALRLEVDAVCRVEPVAVDLEAEPQMRTAIRAALERHAPITEEWRGPAFWLSETTLEPRDAVLVTEANAHVLERHFPWKLTSRNSFKTGVLTASLERGDAVSICFCARLTQRAAEAGVETVESARGRGHAVAAVAVWAQAVRARGLMALYSTDWDNLASRSVARKLGAVLYGEDWSLQ